MINHRMWSMFCKHTSVSWIHLLFTRIWEHQQQTKCRHVH